MLKTAFAVSLAKLSSLAIRLLGAGSATSLPGKLALKLSPGLLHYLGQQITGKTVVITGTNGKSTTAGLTAAFLSASGNRVIHNQLGANMVSGITTALTAQASYFGRLKANYGVIETDEASMPAVSESLHQSVTVVTNLFRDQLDRYGELDTTAKFIQSGIRASGGAMILNADDPMVAAMGYSLPSDEVIYFGVQDVHYPNPQQLDFPVGFPREVTDCPLCQSALSYNKTLYGHLGHYACPNCGFQRPTPWLHLARVDIEPCESRLRFRRGDTLYEPITLQLPGLFNAYNALAAVTSALWCGIPFGDLQTSLDGYQSLFGRAEKRTIAGKSVMFLLIKNPMGAAEVLKVVTGDPKRRVLILINDNYADGRDVSWLWDAPFEHLASESQPVRVSGHRAEDMAVRLKYAGLPEDQICVTPNVMEALEQAVDETAHDETLYVLPTYTVLLAMSKAIKSR